MATKITLALSEDDVEHLLHDLRTAADTYQRDQRALRFTGDPESLRRLVEQFRRQEQWSRDLIGSLELELERQA